MFWVREASIKSCSILFPNFGTPPILLRPIKKISFGHAMKVVSLCFALEMCCCCSEYAPRVRLIRIFLMIHISQRGVSVPDIGHWSEKYKHGKPEPRSAVNITRLPRFGSFRVPQLCFRGTALEQF